MGIDGVQEMPEQQLLSQARGHRAGFEVHHEVPDAHQNRIDADQPDLWEQLVTLCCCMTTKNDTIDDSVFGRSPRTSKTTGK